MYVCFVLGYPQLGFPSESFGARNRTVVLHAHAQLKAEDKEGGQRLEHGLGWVSRSLGLHSMVPARPSLTPPGLIASSTISIGVDWIELNWSTPHQIGGAGGTVANTRRCFLVSPLTPFLALSHSTHPGLWPI